jgi:hypothetical protein
MEYIREININEAVIHILDNNSDEPILNEFKLDLSDEIFNFILKHVDRALKDEELKYAVFNQGRGLIRELSQEYLKGERAFIDISKELARQMFMLIKSNVNIPSCDLMVISISTEYGPMLAILKLDYIKNFIHKVEFVEDKIGINIVPQTTGLPVSSQKVQKCAFIKPLNAENRFDLMVIDKQPKIKDSDEYGSNYFIANFLGCTIVDNERDMTKNFIKATENWTRSNLESDADTAENVRTTIKKKLREEESLDVRSLAQDLFREQEEVQNNFMQFVSSQGLQDNIPVDREYVEKKLKRVRLKIDTDIDLYIDAETYHDSKKFEIQRNGDGSINMIIKHVINYIEK